VGRARAAAGARVRALPRLDGGARAARKRAASRARARVAGEQPNYARSLRRRTGVVKNNKLPLLVPHGAR